MGTDDLINVGYDRTTGQAVTVDQGTYDDWISKGLRGDHSLICLYCHQAGHDVPLVVCYREGGHKRMYFRHPPGMARGLHSPETVWHVDGKLLIARWTRQQPSVTHVELESWTHDRSRRADVLITLTSGTRIAVELQTRALTDADWSARHHDYARQGIVDVWLWHPAVERPGILLRQRVGVWYLDVAESSLGILLAQPHQRPTDWRSAPDISVFAMHHPPCLTDGILRRWYPLQQSALHEGGLQLPAALSAELRAAKDYLHRVAPLHLPARIDCGGEPKPNEKPAASGTPQHDLQKSTDASYVPPPADILQRLHQYLITRLGVAGDIRIGGRSSVMTNGFPVYANDRLIGVACPNPDDPSAWRQLKGLLVFVAANQTRWISRAAPLGTLLRIIRTESNGTP